MYRHHGVCHALLLLLLLFLQEDAVALYLQRSTLNCHSKSVSLNDDTQRKPPTDRGWMIC